MDEAEHQDEETKADADEDAEEDEDEDMNGDEVLEIPEDMRSFFMQLEEEGNMSM